MRTLDAALAAHLGQDATTVCHCWRLSLRNGSVLGFTEHDRDLVFAGTQFQAASGFFSSGFEAEEGLAASTNEVVGGFSSDAISQEALARGDYDGARVEVFLANWQTPEQHQRLQVLEIGEVSREGGGFKAELRSRAHRLAQPQGRSFTRRCDAVFGDAACGFDPDSAGFFATGTVLAVESETRLVIAGTGAFAEGFFAHGTARLESGDLAGLSFDIDGNAPVAGGMRVDLWLPLEHLPETGDQVRLTAGCDKAFSTCRTKFGNHLNFRGFPHVPGADFAYSYVNGESAHDGSPLFK
ncbi:MAG: beta tubulin [Rhizobiaceae bacterium]|nr:beta tubulin [Rhizobiaceae bacterium]|tara:strand:- start:160 stop:1050 length:891 start_codon:yes stop_codon:yes gene_type:complete